MLKLAIKIIFVLIVIIGAYAGVTLSTIYYYGSITSFPVLASLISSWVALVTGILALFKDFILDFIKDPNLVVEFSPEDRRDCHATSLTENRTGTVVAEAYYFRIRIRNRGLRVAEDVEVSLEEVRRYQNNKPQIDQDFMPLRLLWSHWRERRFELSIPKGTYRHCDFGFIIDPSSQGSPLPPQENGKLLFWLDVFPRPTTGRTSLLPGSYRIKIVAFGKNARRASLTLRMEWKGIWEKGIEEMLSKSLTFG